MKFTEGMTLHKAFQYKLEPNAVQEQQFWRYCGAARWVWNHMLAQRNDTYQATGKSPNGHAQVVQLPVMKRQTETAWLCEVHSQVLQASVWHLDEAFGRFFRQQNGYPKFKKRHGRKQSFTYPQGVKVDGNRAFLPKIGWVTFRRGQEGCKRYRQLGAKPGRVTVKRKASGWYISFAYALEMETPKSFPVTLENSIGIDLGSIDLITTSDGEKVVNPRLYRRAEIKLRRAQRSLSRRKRGSNRYAKQKHKVAVLQEKTANQRHDALHKWTTHLIRENQAVFVENLNVRGIAKRMGKSAYDAGWGELVRQLEYKAAWAGKTVVKVDRFFPSSKLCSCCGYKHSALALSERSWQCPSCDAVHDRDRNAAMNIQHEGLRLLTVG